MGDWNAVINDSLDRQNVGRKSTDKNREGKYSCEYIERLDLMDEFRNDNFSRISVWER